MANARMWLVDDETKEAVLLAKGFGEWRLWPGDLEQLDDFLRERDTSGACGGSSSFRLVFDDDFDPGVYTIIPLQPNLLGRKREG